MTDAMERHTFVYDKFIHDLLHAADNNSPSDDGRHHHHNDDGTAILIHKHDNDEHLRDKYSTAGGHFYATGPDYGTVILYGPADHTHPDTPKDRTSRGPGDGRVGSVVGRWRRGDDSGFELADWEG